MTTVQNPKPRKRRVATKERDALRVLVATAGDADSVGALWVASALTQQRSATVLVLGVTPPFPHTFPSIFKVKPPVVADEESRLAMLSDVRECVRDIPLADQWEKAAILGWPGDVVPATAASWRASLIAIGLGRHGAMDRLFGTETAVAVMKHAKVPVIAVAASDRGLPRHACVAVDFTPASYAAATVAASLVAPGGTLSLVHACAFEGVDARPGDLVDLYRSGAKAKLGHAVATMRRQVSHLTVEGEMIDGTPEKTILSFANAKRCDLIALGGHEQGLIDRVILGSVRTHVIRSAQCSVLIAPPVPGDLTAWKEEK